MKKRVNSTGHNISSKQVRTHGRPPAFAKRLFQGICSIFQRHGFKPQPAMPLAYPVGEGVCYHPKICSIGKETTTDDDKPYSPKLSFGRGDENLWIVLTDHHSRWTETIPVMTSGLFLNPLKVPNINTLA